MLATVTLDLPLTGTTQEYAVALAQAATLEQMKGNALAHTALVNLCCHVQLAAAYTTPVHFQPPRTLR